MSLSRRACYAIAFGVASAALLIKVPDYIPEWTRETAFDVRFFCMGVIQRSGITWALLCTAIAFSIFNHYSMYVDNTMFARMLLNVAKFEGMAIAAHLVVITGLFFVSCFYDYDDKVLLIEVQLSVKWIATTLVRGIILFFLHGIVSACLVVGISVLQVFVKHAAVAKKHPE